MFGVSLPELLIIGVVLVVIIGLVIVVVLLGVSVVRRRDAVSSRPERVVGPDAEPRKGRD